MKSWRTTTFGLLAIAVGIWSAHILYAPAQSLYFNVFYNWTGPAALIFSGIGLIHARDHKFKD